MTPYTVEDHNEAWSYKKKKYKKIKGYTKSALKEPTNKKCLLILNLDHRSNRSKIKGMHYKKVYRSINEQTIILLCIIVHSSLLLFYLYTFLMLHVLCVALFVALCCKFSVCTPCFAFSMMQCPVALFSCCILFIVHSFHVANILRYTVIADFFMFHSLHVVLFQCCTFTMLHSFYALLFFCFSSFLLAALFIFHFFLVTLF